MVRKRETQEPVGVRSSPDTGCPGQQMTPEIVPAPFPGRIDEPEVETDTMIDTGMIDEVVINRMYEEMPERWRLTG